MSRPMPRLVVFDLAGTTMQDDGVVAAAFQKVLASEGVDATPEAVLQVRGASKRAAFRTLAGDAERGERLFHHFIDLIRAAYSKCPPHEVPGAAAIFAWLREQGVKVALNTGFERDVVAFLVEALEWRRDTFDAIVCGDEVDAGRPSPSLIQEAMRRVQVPDPSAVMTVGDTVLDLLAGTAAGAGWVLGVTSGAHDHMRLLQAPHTRLIASIADIREVLR